MLHPDGKVEIGHWKRDRLVAPEQDDEAYLDATKSFLMPDRHKPSNARGIPDAEIIGPDEVRVLSLSLSLSLSLRVRWV
jgi:hypothetical protein